MDESSKRRRRGDEDYRRPSNQPAATGGDSHVTDDEVEEFFAILRRMRDARPGPKWSPAFASEDFFGADATKKGGATADACASDAAAAGAKRGKKDAAPRRCLDLNADPEPEGVSRRAATVRVPPPPAYPFLP
ncbi:hypothetical protein C4D60_Mb08t17880 [Musa balbisiana]|uniref:Uncharacterized protein n=1 Tax=Musa balbisiana TaxID=52838 RepID=A0A4S8K4J5_MUSBA|nr:hypothetical protein C4D60_Mb08t17880 [Musa balbisiana]